MLFLFGEINIAREQSQKKRPFAPTVIFALGSRSYGLVTSLGLRYEGCLRIKCERKQFSLEKEERKRSLLKIWWSIYGKKMYQLLTTNKYIH